MLPAAPSLSALRASAMRAHPFAGGLSAAATATLALFLASVLAVRALEGVSWVDAVYAVTGVMTCVGIVITPTTPASRAFTAALNVASLGLGALVLTEIADYRRAWTRSLLRRGGSAPSLAGEAVHLAVAGLPPLLAAAAFFAHVEGWHLSTALYFSLTNGTGLGMDGAVEPKHAASRLAFSAYVWWEMGVLINLLSLLGTLARDSLAKAAYAGAREGDGGGKGVGGNE